MIICTAKRRCVTGVTEYCYYRGDNLIGSASVFTVSGFPVHIRSEKLNLHCELHPEQTIHVEHSTPLFSEGSQLTYAEVIRHDPEDYTLRIGRDSIRIIIRDGIHFYHNCTLIAVMKSTTGPMEGDWESCLTLTAQLPLTNTLLTLLMSFPLIRL